MDIDLLVKITARSWALSILAHLHAGVPGRQAPLLSACGAGRTSFGHSLAHLQTLGLLERNPGYGHPLRPEFRLTAAGVRAAAMADAICTASASDTAARLIRRQWTLPVLAVTRTPRRFSQMKMDLGGGITDRALSQTLGALEDQTWLHREVDVSERPLRPYYQAAHTGLLMSEAVHAAI